MELIVWVANTAQYCDGKKRISLKFNMRRNENKKVTNQRIVSEPPEAKTDLKAVNQWSYHLLFDRTTVRRKQTNLF